MRGAFSSRLFSGVLLTGLAAPLCSEAQPPTFETLKKAHAAEVAKTVQPLRENYVRALLNLEQTLASREDFEGAKMVQKERREMEQRAGLPETGRVSAASVAADGSVSLSVEQAELSNGAKLDDSKKYLTGWSLAGAAARWILPSGLAGGGYEVELSFSLAQGASEKGAGLFQLREDFHTISRPLKPAEVPPAGTEIPALRLGPLRLRSNASTFEIKALTPEAGSGLQIRSLRLIPLSSDS